MAGQTTHLDKRLHKQRGTGTSRPPNPRPGLAAVVPCDRLHWRATTGYPVHESRSTEATARGEHKHTTSTRVATQLLMRHAAPLAVDRPTGPLSTAPEAWQRATSTASCCGQDWAKELSFISQKGPACPPPQAIYRQGPVGVEASLASGGRSPQPQTARGKRLQTTAEVQTDESGTI